MSRGISYLLEGTVIQLSLITLLFSVSLFASTPIESLMTGTKLEVISEFTLPAKNDVYHIGEKCRIIFERMSSEKVIPTGTVFSMTGRKDQSAVKVYSNNGKTLYTMGLMARGLYVDLDCSESNDDENTGMSVEELMVDIGAHFKLVN